MNIEHGTVVEIHRLSGIALSDSDRIPVIFAMNRAYHFTFGRKGVRFSYEHLKNFEGARIVFIRNRKDPKKADFWGLEKEYDRVLAMYEETKGPAKV